MTILTAANVSLWGDAARFPILLSRRTEYLPQAIVVAISIIISMSKLPPFTIETLALPPSIMLAIPSTKAA
jgi:hypothetical protein